MGKKGLILAGIAAILLLMAGFVRWHGGRIVFRLRFDRNRSLRDNQLRLSVRLHLCYHYGMMIGENGEWTGEVQSGLLPPLTIGDLFNVPADIVRVEFRPELDPVTA